MNRGSTMNTPCTKSPRGIAGRIFFRAADSAVIHPTAATSAAWAALLLLLGGCCSPARESSPEITHTPAPPDSSQQQEAIEARNRELQEQLRQSRVRNKVQRKQLLELRLQLAEKDSKNHQLQQSLEQAIQEVVRTKARVRNHYSKAGTVTDLAELKVELESAEEHDLEPMYQERLLRARHYLDMADQALATGNYEGARYLANRARLALGQLKSLRSGDGSHHSAFPVPVVMETRIMGNVRRSPGLEAEILSTLPAGTRVSVTDRQGLWVKIRGLDGKPGWVHFSLLKVLPVEEIPPRGPQNHTDS